MVYKVAEETPVLWPPDVKSRLTGKGADAGKDGGQEEEGATEDEMVGWHPRLDEHEFEQTSADVKDKEAWSAAVHGVLRSRTQLSNQTTYTLALNMEPNATLCVFSIS